MRIRFNGGQRRHFKKAEFRESTEYLKNPGCGWCHVYTFKAQPAAMGRPVEEEIWMDESCREEQLALVLIDIGDFRMTPLSEAALLYIGQIIEFFRRNRKQLLLRFVYDTEGKGMQKEPRTLDMVKQHMEQIGGVIRSYLEDILVLQGIFVGNWGEMHGSRFLDDASMCELVEVLYRITEGRCFLAVRTPAQWRRIVRSSEISPGVRERLALFNDGIFGSPTDLGTYGIMDRARVGETGSWSREEELAWQSRQLEAVPNGGEILSCKPLIGYRQAAEDLRKMHISYLNSVYHLEQLDHWKKETVKESGCWQGMNGYDYIGCHLGYRFTVSDVSERKGKLKITIRNSGFGNLCEEAECVLMIEGEDGSAVCQCLDTDARGWKSGQETVLNIMIPKEGRKTGSRLYLMLKRRSDGHMLRFANQGIKDKLLLGQFGGAIESL